MPVIAPWRARTLAPLGLLALTLTATDGLGAATLTYRDLIEGSVASTLSASVQTLNGAARAVTINGADSQRPGTPFRFDWGDGQVTQGFFPASHTYTDATRNYVVIVTANYGDGRTDSTDVVVRFAPIAVRAFTVPADVAVTVPPTVPAITSTQAGLSVPAVQPFPADAFATVSRAVFERVMGAFAVIQQDLVNDDLRSSDGSFRQIVLAAPEPTTAYAFSVWFTEPVMFVARASVFGADPDWSSVAHEMGHNVTLNSPAAFRLGGKIDGPANAIVSEALAQIFQHVTCHLLVNNAAAYGIPDDLAAEVARRARGSFAFMKRSATGPFASWNDPATPADEALPTFMTVAYQFFATGDLDGVGYRVATKRLMFFLQRFNAQWQTRFSARANSPVAEAFRATMMVAALSFSRERDLRDTFRNLGFPIDDAVFNELTTAVGEFPRETSRLVNLSVRTNAGTGERVLAVGFTLGGSATKQLLVRGVGPTLTGFGVAGTLADPQLRLSNSGADIIHENNDWGGGGFLSAAFAAAGAFALPAASRDSAFVPTLRPGSYSAQVTATTGTGIALVEVYDLEGLGGSARLTNLSARTEVGTGDGVLVAAFVLQGSESKRVLVRAVGPTLAQFGVGGVLADPQLTLFRGAQSIATNNDWGGDAALAAAFTQVGAFALPANSRDAALVTTLQPGTYSAQVSGAGNGTGIALVEVYELP